ncbi:methylated-DNA--[protein]-cysteine S-methyltransferase, partial [Leptospira selangorensis]
DFSGYISWILLSSPGIRLVIVPILDVTDRLGLSGTSRLHDLFIKLEGMTPGRYKEKGAGISLYYEFFPTILGEMIVVSSEKGIQNLQFRKTNQNKMEFLCSIQEELPFATWIEEERSLHTPVKQFLQNHTLPKNPIPLSVLGTPFQLKVWNSLLSIPQGDITTYGEIATAIGKPNAQRAVGSAIGKNPIAVLIPCHRVIQASGLLGGYRWNAKRKQMLLSIEKAKTFPESDSI